MAVRWHRRITFGLSTHAYHVRLPTVRVVVVTYDSAATIGGCVESVLAADGRGFRLEKITVIDNASRDQTADFVPGSPMVQLVRSPTNLGFAAACNLGARGAGADLLLFLNPDTRAEPDGIGRATSALGKFPEVAVCGARLVDHSGRTGVCAARFPRVRSYLGEVSGLSRLWPRLFPPHLLRLDGRGVVPVDQVSGAFCLIWRRLFEEFHGFDTAYFLYYEDADLAYRLRAAGWRSVVCLDAECVHEGGGSSKAVLAERLFLNLRSRLIFARQHMAPLDRVAVYLITLVIEPIARTLFLAWTRSSPVGFRALAAAYCRLLVWAARRAPRPPGRGSVTAVRPARVRE